MKTNKFGIVSAAISGLIILCTFAFNFIFVEVADKGISAWNLFSGGDEFAEAIREDASGGFLILVAVLLLVANIAVQFKVPALAKKFNFITAIACVAIYAIAAVMLLGNEKLEAYEPGLAFGAYLIIIASVAMIFVPKMLDKK
jgi:hypothetical protein